MPREATWDTASNRNAMGGVTTPQRSIPDNEDPGRIDWLQLARNAYESSNGWMEANLRTQWQRNLRTFNNKHPTGSKYLSQEFRHRSKVVRPKSRTATRRTEAAAAQAFFSTLDLVEVEAENEGDARESASAAICKALLNLRLNRKPIRWFPTLLGAWQDTRTLGVCISKQTWCYEEQIIGTSLQPDVDELGMQRYDPMTGAPSFIEVPQTEVVKDHPECRLIAPENLRIDPGANWMDPINSSPFVIELIPMYVGDVKNRMQTRDTKTGQPPWFQLPDNIIRQAATLEYNSTRQARENYRQDSKDKKADVYDHDIVWIHENVARVMGRDYHWFTLGIDHLLSEPQKLGKFYLQDERPWVMGYSIIEAHKTYPAGGIELTEGLQQLTTEISNQRIDNVRFAMNPRQFARAGKGVDYAALQRSVPGKVVTMNTPTGPDADVFVDRPPDVTGSAYKEQDYINADFDELAGNFSSSSVNTNRRMGETVGGMNILRSGANEITTYDLSVFAESWAEPVLEQLIRLEQAYETDTTVLAVAGRKAQLMQRFGINEINDELLQKKMTVRVNVGVGATDPTEQMERMGAGLKAAAELYGDQKMRFVNGQEVMEEIWGILGYRDGKRFHLWPEGQDSATAQLQQIIDQLMQMLKAPQQEQQLELALAKMDSMTKTTLQKMKDDSALIRELIKGNAAMMAQRVGIAADAAGQVYDTQDRRISDEAARRHQSAEASRARTHESTEAEAGRRHASTEAEAGRRHEASEAAAARDAAARQPNGTGGGG